MFFLSLLTGFCIWVIFSSFFEWTLHRYLMHRPLGFFRYPFQAHAVVHHRTFKADHTYHLHDEADKHTIPMAWWNGPVLTVISTLPMVIVAWIFGNWALALGAVLSMSAYYGAYEYIHWCMHLPKARRVEPSGLFRRLNGHHLLHHRYMTKNFNVVLPLADWCLGTLLKRAPVSFAQPRGAAVPDVQPIDVGKESDQGRAHRSGDPRPIPQRSPANGARNRPDAQPASPGKPGGSLSR
jgi:hypothetical protein